MSRGRTVAREPEVYYDVVRSPTRSAHFARPLTSGHASVSASRYRRAETFEAPVHSVIPKQSKRPRIKLRPEMSQAPVPSPETVGDMQRRLFSGRFADNHLSALLGRASVAISAEFHEDV